MKTGTKNFIFVIRKYCVCFLFSVFTIHALPAYAAISTVASEQSGTTVGIINHVGTGTFVSRNNCGNISPTIPAGSVGDLLIAVAVIRENTTNVTMPGWNLYYSGYHGVDGNQDLGGYIFWRIATGGDPNTITSTSTGGPANCQSLRGRISRFDGVNTTAPFETNPILAGNSSTQNTANVTTGTETTTTATAMSIAVTFINDNAVVTEADGFSESFDSASAANRDSAISLNYRQEATAGAKGAFTWPQNLGTDESIGVLFALTPDNSLDGISINVPTGTTTNDVMLAAISVRPSTTTITAPAGWTLINRVNQAAGNSNSQATYYRVATSTEPTAYVWAFSGVAITGTAGGIITYRGVDTTSPIDASGGNTTVSGTSHTANSINTTVANTMIVSTHSFSSSETWTPPAGMTEQVDVASLTTPNAAGISLEMNDVLQAATGATGNKTATVAGNADTGVAQLVALTPIVITNTVTVTLTGNVDNINGGSISLTGTSLGTPEATATGTETTDADNDITTNITTLTNNAWLIDTVGDGQPGSFTPGAGQTERWDTSADSSTGAMSTKPVATAGLDSMTQDFDNPPDSNRIAHAIIAVAPAAGSTIAFDAAASNDTGAATTSTLSWTHTFVTNDTINTKLIVGITIEEPSGCGTGRVSSVTYGNISLTQAATVLVDDTYCHQVEIWYADLRNIIVSTNNNSTLGGQAIDQDEAVEYDILNDSGTLFFDDATFAANETLNGIHQYTNGNLAVTTAGGATIGGNTFANGDIVEVTPSGSAGVYNFVGTLFAETNFTADETVDAVYVRGNGNIILSTTGNATLPMCGGGNLNFIDDDLVEWDPTNTCATMFLDESATTNLIPNAGGDEDIDGVHLLNDDSNLILFSIANNNTIRGTAVLDGDVVLYNRNTDTASIYFSEANFTSGGEDVDALTLDLEIVLDQVDHYEITYPNGAIGLTCEASQVTITAHDSSDNVVNVLGGTVLTINAYIDGTTTNTGTWESVVTGNGTFGGAGNPVTYTWPSGTEESSVTLELRQLTALTIDIDLSDDNGDMEKGNGDNSDAEDPEIEFRDAVFRVVDNSTPPVPVSISAKLSGKQSNTAGTGFQDLYLQAIETVSAVECQGVFESENNVTVELASECNNPTACETVQIEVEDDSATLQAIAGNPNGSVTSYTGVQFDFDADSKTPLRFVYDDAGQVTLHARFDIDPPNMVYNIGMSNAFVVKPAGICVETTDANADCMPASATCTVFRKASEAFNLTINGVTWDSVDGDADSDYCTAGGSGNVTTPNFEITGIELNSNVIEPSGGVDGDLLVTSIDILNADKGTDTHTQSIDEVGVFTITASGDATAPATAISYLGDTISPSTSINIGRFTPDHFAVSANTPDFADSCNSTFTYMDQPFYYNTAPVLTVTAMNGAGTPETTLNYGMAFWKLTTLGADPESVNIQHSYSDNSGLTASQTNFTGVDTVNETLSDHNDLDGVAFYTLTSGSSGDVFSYDRVSELVAPFAADADVSFTAFSGTNSDEFDLTDNDGICYDGNNNGTCEAIAADNFVISNISGANLRLGRLFIGNVVGSELLSLPVPLEAQYYDGTTQSFITNTDDGCTAIATTDLSLTSAVETGETDGNVDITNAGTCGGTGVATATMANATFASGSGGLSFDVAAPAAGCTGFIDTTLDLSTGGLNMDWLQYDWADEAGDGPFNVDPSGRAEFGLFQGPRQLIYIREPW